MNEIGRKLKIEVLDDEPDFSKFVCSVASLMGFQATSPLSPQSFVKQYTADKEILFLDLYMPGIDGVDLLRFMANAAPPAAIVLMSGGDELVLKSAQNLAEELGLNVVDVIRKPIRKKQLESILSKLPGLVQSNISGVERVGV